MFPVLCHQVRFLNEENRHLFMIKLVFLTFPLLARWETLPPRLEDGSHFFQTFPPLYSWETLSPGIENVSHFFLTDSLLSVNLPTI